MCRTLAVLALALACAGTSQAAGLLIPEEKKLPPLAMLEHKVTISIQDQVAITKVEQTFRNHTNRQLEATYIFPVPKGATVNKFTMWVGGKETKGELLPAKKAREIYNSIVRRTQDPGLLEYIDSNMLRLRVFPVPARGDQKVSFQFTSVCPKDGKLTEYIYPLKTDGKAVQTLEKYSITATIKSQHNVINVYSPSHTLSLKRTSDKEVSVSFDKNQGMLDRDFQLFYSTGKDDVGLTILTHRPVSSEKGFFTLLITPKWSMGEKQRIPQDVVLVLDTSGSMRGKKMEQARKALKYCLEHLDPKDRFGLLNFATDVNTYEDKLLEASNDQKTKAKKWVDDLDAVGGTAINKALLTALEMRPKNGDRPFTVVFFTDGEPTIGETDVNKIYKNAMAKNTASTRIFTFGVGDDVNAALLDRLAENTRALSTYVRPAEDIEAKVSALYAKMTSPVLTNLKLTTTADVKFSEIYPIELPDLFRGGQLVVMGRYSGKGASAIKLTGKVGKESKEFVYEFTFPEKSDDGKEFVEHLWARRKVGFLLDQIRLNGEKKELVDEVTKLAKKYGITTPYTSYLVVPDGVTPSPRPVPPGRPRPLPVALAPAPGGKGKPQDVESFARGGGFAKKRNKLAEDDLNRGIKAAGEKKDEAKSYQMAKDQKQAYDRVRSLLKSKGNTAIQTGKAGVDLAVQVNNLRMISRVEQTASRAVLGRNCLEVGGVWVDDGFTAKTEAVVVKAQSDAYFRILAKQPQMKKVFQLGNYLVWVAPSGKALVIDMNKGKEKMSDADIAALFKASK